jgi:hypothetical protein
LPLISSSIPWPETQKSIISSGSSAVSQIIVGTSASALAAFLIEFLYLNRVIKEKQANRAKFLKLLGSNSDNPKVMIAIPRFKGIQAARSENKGEEGGILEGSESENVQITSTITPNVQITSTITPKESVKLDSSDCFLSDLDTSVAINLVTLFASKRISHPEIIYADQDNEIGEGNFDVLFLIGLFSNHTLKKTYSPNCRTFELLEESSSSEPSGFKIAERVKQISTPPNSSSRVFRGSEYGLLAKIVADGKIIFVIGGVNAKMTAFSGTYFSVYWPDIANIQGAFAICLNQNGSNPEYAYPPEVKINPVSKP